MAGIGVPAGALLVLLLVAPARAAQRASPAPAADSFVRLAAELGALSEGVAPEVVGQRLPAVSPDSARLLFEALSLAELPLSEGVLVLGEREHAALLEGARRLGGAALAPLWNAAAAGKDAGRRRTAIELIGLCGHAADLDTALRAAAPPEGEPADSSLLGQLELACTRLLARDHATLAALRPALLHASAETGGYLVRAAGSAPDERTLGFFADLLSFDEHLDLPLLSEIARVARGAEPPFEEGLRAHVRKYLASEDRQLVRMAVLALVELEDEEAVPPLVELCATPDKGLSEAVYLALERTSGLALPRRPERWRAWFQTEQRWLAGEGAVVSAVLNGGDVTRIQAALRSLGDHRLARQRFALLAGALLAHDDARVRLEACRTLGALAVRSSRVALEQALSDPDPGVAAAAQAALRACERQP